MATEKTPRPPTNYDMWRFLQKARAAGVSDTVSIGERILEDLRAHAGYKIQVYSEKPQSLASKIMKMPDPKLDGAGRPTHQWHFKPFSFKPRRKKQQLQPTPWGPSTRVGLFQGADLSVMPLSGPATPPRHHPTPPSATANLPPPP